MNTLEYQVGPPLPVACLAAVTGRVGVAADRVLGWGGEIAERGSGRRRAPASRRHCGRSSRGWNDPPAEVEGREIGVFGLGWAISRSGLVVL